MFGHWQTWLSGGGFGGLIVVLVNLIERLTGRRLSHKSYGLIFVAAFLICACFIVWIQEHAERGNLSKNNKALTDVAERAKAESAQKDGTINALRNQLQDQQATINRFIAELGNKIAPEPLRLTALRLENDRAGHHVKWIILTSRIITPVSLAVECDGGIANLAPWILGASGMMGGGGGKLSDRGWEVRIDSPAWTPTSPLALTITYTKDDHGVCRFQVR